MKSPICPVCQRPAVEARTTIRFRRGSRVLPVETRQWRCPGDCVGPRGERPFVFADLATMKANEAKARAEWEARYGEPMPPARRGGRPSEEPHDERLQVRLTSAELEALDAARGEVSRSDFVRMFVLYAVTVIPSVDTSKAFLRGANPQARTLRRARRQARANDERAHRRRVPVPLTPAKGASNA